jgi:hypothetical protein
MGARFGSEFRARIELKQAERTQRREQRHRDIQPRQRLISGAIEAGPSAVGEGSRG